LTREPKVSFLHGAFILASAAMISRVLGAVYRIPLTRLIGDYGMGLYGAGYNIYIALYAIATVGINVAISKLMAERLAHDDEAGAARVFGISLVMLALVGVVSAVGLAMAAKPIAEGVMRNPDAYHAIVALAPAIFFTALQGSFRGYFQGYQQMAVPAVSQVTEQLFRVASLLFLAHLLMARGPALAAGGAAFGAAVGAAVGLSYLLWAYARSRHRVASRLRSRPRPALGTVEARDSAGVVVRRIFALAIPISIAGVVVPLMGLVDLFVVPFRLQIIGYTVTEATRLFGQLSQMAMTLVNLPTVVTLGLQTSLVPAISEAQALGDRAGIRSKTSSGLRATFLIALPAVTGVWLLATPITTLLFNVPQAGVALAAISGGILFLMLQQTSSGVLQGLGRTDIPVKNLIIGAVVKTILAWVLTAVPALNIRGAAYSTVFGFAIAAALNLIAVHRLVGFRVDIIPTVLKPLFATVLMGGVVYAGFGPTAAVVGSNLGTLIMVAAGGAVYGVALLLIGGVRERDFAFLPRLGPRLATALKKMGLLRD
jgi:stage V sporulation protein B